MTTLKSVLTINGVTSGITGFGLALLPGVYADLFEIPVTAPFIGVGIFLIVFAAFVLVASRRFFNPPVITAITIADTAWVIGSAVLLIFQPFSISLIGNIIILAVALWVLLMAVLQYRGLRTIL